MSCSALTSHQMGEKIAKVKTSLYSLSSQWLKLPFWGLCIFLLMPFSMASAFEVNKTDSGADIKWSTPNETYYVNETGGPAGSLAAIQAGAQTWTDVSTSSFTFIYGGTTTSTAHGVNDGHNIILFVPIDTPGVLASNHFWYNTGTGEIIDSDIKFNTTYTWATDGSLTAYDVQNVATHELGHSLSLSDLYNDSDSEKTMYGYSSKGETKQRTLTQDDINGITYLYASSVDTTPPTGSVSISNGSAYTKSTSVTLTLSASDSSGVYQMCISNATTCSSWESYATTKSWTLSSGDGTKTVYVWFKDNAGNANPAPFSSTILLDTTAPTGSVSINNGSAYTKSTSVTLTLSASDSSGVNQMCISNATTCSSWESYATTKSWTLSSGDGTKTVYVWFKDNAGNANPAPFSSTILLDTTAPTGSVSINNGSAYTKSTSVTLTLSASDSSGVNQMCISNATTCSSWETYAATKSWILSSGDGTKTVYVWFKDNAGNANPAPFSSTILLDTTAPVNGTLSASSGTSQILMSWSGFSDAASGIQSYKIVYTTTASPASCSSGTQIYSGSAISYNHTGLANGSKYYYRVCAIDKAGNTSTGATATAVTQSQATTKIPLPTTQQTFTYPPIAIPVTNIDPSLAKPIGLGSVASNGTNVSLQTATAEFEGKVDVYFALYAPSIDAINLYILKSDLTFQPLSDGLVPWKTGITGPLDEKLFGDIPTVFLTGAYYFGLLVSPEGSGVSGGYYFWITSFEVKSP